MKKLVCLSYKGEGKDLVERKNLIKEICKDLRSYVRVSTCQRIEIYTDKDIPSLKNLEIFSYPFSMQHLIGVLSGIDSGLFGEIEIYLQIKESLEKSKEENHVSVELEEYFNNAFRLAEDIRQKFNLDESWIKSIERKIMKDKPIYIHGKGKLAISLASSLSKKGFQVLDNQENAKVIIILNKDFILSNNSDCKKIINLIGEKVYETELTLKDFFSKPGKQTFSRIKKEISKKLEVESNL